MIKIKEISHGEKQKIHITYGFLKLYFNKREWNRESITIIGLFQNFLI